MTAGRARTHREFFRLPADGQAAEGVSWQRVPGFEDEINELVLSDNLDPHTRSGSRTRLARWAPGTLLDMPVEHDYHEEILVLEGDLVVGCDADGNGGEEFRAYSFASRPAGTRHGPFTTRAGCLMLEFDSYD